MSYNNMHLTPGVCQFGLWWQTPHAQAPVQLAFPAGSSWKEWGLTPLILESMKQGKYIRKESTNNWPAGTIKGIKTVFLANSIVESLEPLEANPFKVYPDKFGTTSGLTKELLWAVMKGKTSGGYVYQEITGLMADLYNWSLTPNPSAPTDIDQAVCIIERVQVYRSMISIAWLAKNNPYKYTGGGSKFVLQVYATLGTVVPAPVVDPTYHLYHRTKINAEIVPEDGTVLPPGSFVTIDAYPKADRVLTSFVVQDVEQLPEAANRVTLDPRIIIIPTPTPDPAGLARMIYGPVTSDVYVDAIAIGVLVPEHITAGITTTLQMTTTDCHVDVDSWELGATDLPVTAVYSISETGLVSVFFPEDVYDGSPATQYYLDVIFNGYSQVKTLRLILTVDPVPAFGTVWTAVTKLDEPITAMHYATDGYVYIATTTKMWRTNDLVTFEPITLSTAPSTTFCDVGECSLGIVASDRYSLWLMPTGTTTLTKIAATTVVNYFSSTALSASVDSPQVSLQAVNSLGRYYIMNVWNLDTTTKVFGPVALSKTGGIAQSYATKPVQAKDGSWIFVGAGSGFYGLGRYADGVFTLIEDDTACYGGTTPALMVDRSTGKVYLTGHKSALPSLSFVRSSTDHGVTWTADTLVATTLNVAYADMLSLKKDYALLAQGSLVDRSTDALASIPVAQTLNGTISSFVMIGERKLLAGTNGATTNLYKSEV